LDVEGHQTSSAKVSRERVERRTPSRSKTSIDAGTMEAGGAAAMVPISTRPVTKMPKWVIYCAECNRPATYAEIDSASIDLADPSVKKPVLPDEGDKWDCPFCKKETRVRECDLTYSYA
jgi:hypothetical protein